NTRSTRDWSSDVCSSDLAAGDGAGKERLLKKLSTAPGAKNDTVGFLRHQAEAVYRTAEKLRDAAAKYKSTVMYPGELGAQLRSEIGRASCMEAEEHMVDV